MKKFLTLALALVMVLGLAAPAMAYTTKVPQEQGVSPYSVRIYMVEYKDVDVFSGWITMPPSDRGYATNEVVAFIGELTVPKSSDVYADWYRMIRFKSKNVNFWVTDNYVWDSLATANVPWLANTVGGSWNGLDASKALVSWTIDGDGNTKLTHGIKKNDTKVASDSMIPKVSSAKTYKWLGFGKVTGDDATISFILSRGAEFFPIATAATNTWNQLMATGIIPAGFGVDEFTDVLVVNEDYVVFKASNGASGTYYFVYENNDDGFGFAHDKNGNPIASPFVAAVSTPGELQFVIETVNSAGKTDRMWVFPGGEGRTAYRLHTEPTRALMDIMYSVNLPNNKLEGDQVKPGSTEYDSVVVFYNKVVVDAFGFDAWNRGNLLKDGDWEDVAAAAWDLSDTVDVEPWTPYVAVPENIVTDPPKTGDASVLGFVMIALAAAAAVVVRKVRA